MLKVNSQLENILQALDSTYTLCIMNEQGTLLYVNDYLCKVSGYEKIDLIGQSYELLKLELKQIKDDVYKTVMNQTVWKGNIYWTTKKDDKKYFHFIIVPIHNDTNDIREFLFIGHNMTEHKKTDVAIKEKIENLTHIKNALDEASIVAITDHNGIITHVNDKFCEISQYKREELIGKSHRIINSNYHPKSFIKNMWDTIKSGKTWSGEIKNRAKNGSYYWVQTTIVPFLNKEGIVVQFIAIRTDITARIQAENELQRMMENDFKKIVQNLEHWLIKLVKKDDNIIVSLSEGKLAAKLNLTTDDILNNTLYEIFSYSMAYQLDEHARIAFNNKVVRFETYFSDLYIDITLSPVSVDGKVTEIVGSITDITERKKAEDTILYMARYDSLTDLANRRYFSKLLNQKLKKAKQTNESFGVFFIDLDRFKNINDSLGHGTGDAILKRVADHLRHSLNKNDVAARQGGDEFTLIISDVTREEAGNLATKIIKMHSSPVALDHLELYTTPSIGISMYPNDGKTAEELIKNADSAMYVAKQHGGNTYQYYTKELHEALLTKVELEVDLRRAIEEKQFELYYQPKIDLSKNKIIGTEALIRWNHPKHGLISPGKFIPIAEETGLIVEIGKWVLYTASKQTKLWQEAGLHDLTVAVNISLRQFLQNNINTVIEQILAQTKLEPNYLEIEITESMTSDADYTINTLNRIKKLGVIISIDDFGTGYSSLSYLSKFPVDKLKIDQSFVRMLDDTNKSIIKAVIDIARNLNIDVIAEGVENQEQLDFLIEQMCTEAQGYYFSKPLPASEVATILRES